MIITIIRKMVRSKRSTFSQTDIYF